MKKQETKRRGLIKRRNRTSSHGINRKRVNLDQATLSGYRH
jgi:hypothetical protein